MIKKEDKEILGEIRQYLTIKILHNDMTVMVPCENAAKAGLRRVIDEFGGLEELLAATDGELETVDGVGEIRAKDIREGLRRLQEINLVDRYLQT